MSERIWKKVLESDLENVASEMKDALVKPSVVILTGPVGAGKTTFTKSFIGEALGQIQSPTYSLINEAGSVAHADFYRLNSPEELIHLEIPLYLEDKDFFLVEWGRDYTRELERQVGPDFLFYELVIEINEPSKEGDVSTRNFILSRLES